MIYDDIDFKQTLLSRIENLEIAIRALGCQPCNDRVVGIELATEITGYKQPTIYKKVKENSIPFSRHGRKLFFSEKQLREWTISPRTVLPLELASQPNRKSRRRPSLLDRLARW